ncbi:MAG: decaprenyl-phosphate phosphoribosyltransferase [Desulfuromonadales bacterium]|nr:decaprenyl-phosphate phosphoribosyltransferase [Desulfuromonadales bacterium]
MKIKPLVMLLRPHQWLKNLILFFPAFLGGKLTTIAAFGHVLWLAPLAFCLASSAAYIFNDILDRDHDRHHPQKKFRPIAAGKISLSLAATLGAILLLAGLLAAAMVSKQFLFTLAAYLFISVGYSFGWKKRPIVDIFCISAGFLLRLLAGGFAFEVNISDWLFLSVFLLSIFLSAGKRAGEQILLGVVGGQHRVSLAAYPPGFLEGVMIFTGASVLVTYAMYTITHAYLVYTVPLCAFGLLRYLLRVKQGEGGDPTESLLKDKTLFVVGGLWVFMIGWGLYGSK